MNNSGGKEAQYFIVIEIQGFEFTVHIICERLIVNKLLWKDVNT